MINKYEINWELYKKYIRESRSHGVRLAVFIGWNVLAAAAVALMVFTEFSLFYLLVAVFSIYRGWARDMIAGKNTFKSTVQMSGDGRWMRTVIVSDDEISIEDPKTVTSFPLSDITQVIRKPDELCVVIQGRIKARLYRDSFISGSFEECEALLPADKQF